MNILMVGPSKNFGGGMSTVINHYLHSSLMKKARMYYVPSAVRGNLFIKYLFAAFLYIRVFFILLFGKTDLVHIHMASRGSFYRKRIVVLLCRIFSVKVIIHLHSGEFVMFYDKESNDKQKKMIQSTLDKSQGVIVLSDEWKESLKRITKTRIFVVNNGIPVKDTYQYNGESRNIIFVGNISWKKGVYDIISVIPVLIHLHPEITFSFCGTGELDKVSALLEEKNIGRNVKMHGWVDGTAKEELYLNASILLLPSYYEGMPMAILEAMSYGIPVIATKIGGIPEMIEDGINGCLIEPGNRSQLADCILKLIENNEARMTISKNAYSTFLYKYDMETHVNHIYDVYQTLCSNNSVM